MERFADETDLLIVGGGPAGLAAAIRFKQLCEKNGTEQRVTVLEKAPQRARNPRKKEQKFATLEPRASGGRAMMCRWACWWVEGWGGGGGHTRL
jgi:electron-transferring-flavoprotein dehydrogenase